MFLNKRRKLILIALTGLLISFGLTNLAVPLKAAGLTKMFKAPLSGVSLAPETPNAEIKANPGRSIEPIIIQSDPAANRAAGASRVDYPDNPATRPALNTTKPFTMATKLIANDAAPNDLFGASVALEDDKAVVGAYLDDAIGAASGSVYVFAQNGTTPLGLPNWTQQAKLTASDSTSGDFFGRSVGLSKDTIVAGAPGDNNVNIDAGAAYIFVWDGSNWAEQAKLLSQDGLAENFFGAAVAIDDDTVVIGAPGQNEGYLRSGFAYVFTRNGNTWSQVAKLTADDAAPGDFFGRSVALKGNTIIVGAPGKNTTQIGSGRVYIFKFDGTTWSQAAKLTATDAGSGDEFGDTVSISNNTILVGSPENDEAGQDAGAAYIFTEDNGTWHQEVKLMAVDAMPGDEFGDAALISDNIVLIGAPGSNIENGDTGSAYLFKRVGRNWILKGKLTPGDVQTDDFFGYALAIYEETAVISAHLDDDGGNKSGSAYVYGLSPLLMSVARLPIIFKSPPPAPDLSISDVTVSDLAPQVAQPVTISVTIHSTGTLPITRPFWVDLYMATNPIQPVTNQLWDESFDDDLVPYGVAWRVYAVPADGDTLLTNLNPNDLAGTCDNYSNFIPNDVGCWPKTWKGIPLNNYFTDPGTYYLYVLVDSLDDESTTPSPNGLILEGNENNNLFGPVVITVSGSSPLPRPRSSDGPLPASKTSPGRQPIQP